MFNYTRYQVVEGVFKFSYLDYFITCGLPSAKFELRNNFCNSDHLTLELIVRKDEMKKLVQVREVVESHDMTRKRWLGISEVLSNTLLDDNPTEKLLELFRDLSGVYKPRVRRIKNVFNLANKCSDKIRKAEAISFEEVRNVVRKIKNDDWNGFLGKLNDLQINRRVKEYFESQVLH
jgi:hypothetical protein